MSNADLESADDPYGQEDFLAGEGLQKPKRGHGEFRYQKTPMSAIHTSYNGKAFWTLLGYFLFWIVGFVMNLYYLRQARSDSSMGYQVDGMGCLWALLIVLGVGWITMLCVLVTIGGSVADVFNQIQETMGAP